MFLLTGALQVSEWIPGITALPLLLLLLPCMAATG